MKHSACCSPAAAATRRIGRGSASPRDPAAEWKLAGEYHDARDPWTFRFGGGQEQQSGVPEPRAGVYALGLGWRFKHSNVDFALTHRTLQRPGEPTSYDERVLLGITVP